MTPEHASRIPPAAEPGHSGPNGTTSLAGLRATLAGARDDAVPDAALWDVRKHIPSLGPSIAAEYEFRNRVIAGALEAGVGQIVVFQPDLRPWPLAHEMLPDGTDCRVLYLLDDAEPAVRSLITNTCRDILTVGWVPAYPRVEVCLHAAAVAGEIDLTKPICALVLHALQHMSQAKDLIAGLWNVLPPGSWVAVTHLTLRAQSDPGEIGLPQVAVEFRQHTGTPLVVRHADELAWRFQHPNTWDFLDPATGLAQGPGGTGTTSSTADGALMVTTLLVQRPATNNTGRSHRSPDLSSFPRQKPATVMRSAHSHDFLAPLGFVPGLDDEEGRPTPTRVNAALLERGQADISRMGGHLRIDQELARHIDRQAPGYVAVLLAQRRFRDRVIADAAGTKGITQFADAGAQLPAGRERITAHTIASAHATAARTVLVPRDVYVGAHLKFAVDEANANTDEPGHAAVVPAAIHDVLTPLLAEHGDDRWSLDPAEPLCITIGDLSHWPGKPKDMIRAYHDEVAVGSVIAFSFLGTAPADTPEAGELEALRQLFRQTVEPELTLRDGDDIETWFPGWKILPPGVTTLSSWLEPEHDTTPASRLPIWCVVAEKVDS
ncbi:SAM-dependent methyltransferase [Amycolatopsis sp. lyj-112]|uniref:SAM-dependent methyltransferase n=1 Tax=Amycolatopsis sp. lyj-112 TaxID=2789288 RepID=UPI003978693D